MVVEPSLVNKMNDLNSSCLPRIHKNCVTGLCRCYWQMESQQSVKNEDINTSSNWAGCSSKWTLSVWRGKKLLSSQTGRLSDLDVWGKRLWQHFTIQTTGVWAEIVPLPTSSPTLHLLFRYNSWLFEAPFLSFLFVLSFVASITLSLIYQFHWNMKK